MKKALLFTASLATALAFAGASVPSAFAKPSIVKALDSDNDGTLDAAEIEAAASAVFARLEKDQDGTVDHKEIGARLAKKDFGKADPDGDGTLSKDEYLAAVSTLFKAADTDGEGTLDAKELASKPGRALTKLIR